MPLDFPILQQRRARTLHLSAVGRLTARPRACFHRLVLVASSNPRHGSGREGKGAADAPKPCQLTRFSPHADAWLPEKRLTRLHVEVIAWLNLSAVSDVFRGPGSATYLPQMSLGIWV